MSVGLSHTTHQSKKQEASLQWIYDQNQEAEAVGLVERLWVEVEVLKEQARHMQRQMPKLKKKRKQSILNDRN